LLQGLKAVLQQFQFLQDLITNDNPTVHLLPGHLFLALADIQFGLQPKMKSFHKIPLLMIIDTEYTDPLGSD
jgi:hypothetical protein